MTSLLDEFFNSEHDCLGVGDCLIEDNGPSGMPECPEPEGRDPSWPVSPEHGRVRHGRLSSFDDRASILGTVTGKDNLTEARALVDEIVRHARADDYPALLDIDGDPRTRVLLDALPERQTRSAEVYLKGARGWRSRQNEKARSKLQAASKALDELDVVLARGILRKIDSEVLEQPELARYDELLLAVEARALEMEDIESGLPTLPPDDKPRQRKRWWRG